MELLDKDQAAQDLKIPEIPKSEELEKVAVSATNAAHSIVINSPIMYELAAEELKTLQTQLASLTEKRFSITRPMDAAKKAVMSLFSSPIERCEKAIEHLKAGMLAYQKQEREKAEAAQRLIEDAARQERLRLEAKAREDQAAADKKAREIALAKAEAEAEAQKAELAAAVKDNEGVEEAYEKLLALSQTQAAAEADLKQAAERAYAAQSIASVLTAPVVASEAPKVKGVSISAPWTAEVTDLLALVKFVAANPQYINFLQENITPIKQQAKALQKNCKIDGVRVFQEDRLTSRRSSK